MSNTNRTMTTTFAFTKNKRTGAYDVIGPAGAQPGDTVTVSKRDGSTSQVTLLKGGAPFEARFGALRGQQAQIWSIEMTPRSGGHAKRCWECGCRFTYAEARANDGDWGDSYCGC